MIIKNCINVFGFSGFSGFFGLSGLSGLNGLFGFTIKGTKEIFFSNQRNNNSHRN